MKTLLIALVSWTFWLTAALADQQRVAGLFDALNMADIISIMHDEGKRDAADTIEIYTGQMVDDGLNARIDAIFDTAEMQIVLINKTSEKMSDAHIAEATEFLNSDVGARANTLETTARRAISDDAIEEYALSQFNDASDLGRYTQFRDIIVALDLIDQNTYGAMGAQYVFMMELGKTNQMALTDADINELLRAGEAELRDGIRAWLYGFFNMAYAPLSDEDLATYIQFQQSEAGKALNSALFAGFNELSVRHAQKMGIMIAELMQVQDL